MQLIDADKVKNIIYDHLYQPTIHKDASELEHHVFEARGGLLYTLLEKIKHLETVEERKKGKWLVTQYEDKDGYGEAYICSECKTIDFYIYTRKTPYCPHCGAEMENAE